jgi:hypothetical protein
MSRVLLLTRDPNTETLAERALSSGGHQVISVRTSEAAIRSLFNVRIDAAVVDSAIGEQEVKEFCGCPAAAMTATRSCLQDPAEPAGWQTCSPLIWATIRS